jgi:hypothetical protein
MILQIGDILISSDILTEQFCCDLSVCHGACCIEGDAGAPITIDEVAEIEEALDACWPRLSAQAQTVIDRQGVAYTDEEGDLVTSIVAGKDCVFTFYDTLDNTDNCCLCALEKAFRDGKTRWCKPISCALYPIREKRFSDGTIALNYHRWAICQCGRDKGRSLQLPVYQFLREPLIRRFGQAWYDELCTAAEELKAYKAE